MCFGAKAAGRGTCPAQLRGTLRERGCDDISPRLCVHTILGGCVRVAVAITCVCTYVRHKHFTNRSFINTHTGLPMVMQMPIPTQIVNDITTMHGRACESSLCLELFRDHVKR